MKPHFKLLALMRDDGLAASVTKTMLGAIDINPFAVELLVENIRSFCDFERTTAEKPFQFRYNGVLVRLSFDPDSSKAEEDRREAHGLPRRNPHYCQEADDAR